jgi:hypothetical protein
VGAKRHLAGAVESRWGYGLFGCEILKLEKYRFTLIGENGVAFSLTKLQLQELRSLLMVKSDTVISMVGHTFKVVDDNLYFATSGIPSEYYFEMTFEEIIVLIDDALIK